MAKENLILEHLTALRNELASFKAEVHADLHDLKVRVTSMEEGQAGIHRGLDRLDERVHRIERRLDLAEADTR